MGAASTGNISQVLDLLSRGVDVNMVDAMDQSSLHHACMFSSSPTFRHGHSFYTKDRSRDGHLRVAKELIHKGANVDMQDQKGFTPLYLSVRVRHLNMVAYLIEVGGANIDIPSRSGYTPLALAAEMGNLDIVEYLVDHGADLNFANVKGSTPISNAVKNGHLDVVRYLGERGADMHKSDSIGRTPLCIASQLPNVEILNYLINATPLSTIRMPTSVKTGKFQGTFVDYPSKKSFSSQRSVRVKDPTLSDESSDDEFNFDDINSGVTTKSRAKRTGRQANTASGVSRNWILFKELS